MRLLLLVYICIIYFFNEVYSTRHDMHEKMYVKLNSNAACFRRLNGTHQFGCSSNRSGNVGIVHVITNMHELDNFMDTSVESLYVVVLYMDMFVTEVMNRLSTHNKVSGVIVIVQKPHLPDHYSPDDVCDNSLENCNNHKWNPLGNKFLYYDWPFPIFVADDTQTIMSIIQCYNDFNLPFENVLESRPLCSLHIRSHMSAAVNSPVCLRRTSQAGVNLYKYCDPMGDQNIILPMEIWEENKTRNIIIVAARLDTASLFDGLAPGALTSVTSFVTAITVAHIFSSFQKKLQTFEKSVVFMLLNGEAQDHIGSSRIVYDIEKGQFSSMTSLNVAFENITSFIELSQIGANSTLFIHPSNEKASINIMEELSNIGKNYSLEMKKSIVNELPPSSFKVFKKAHNNIPGVVITSFDKEYTNRYYNGLLDDYNSLGYIYANGSITEKHILQKNLASLASAVASLLYKIITESENIGNIPQIETALLVDELLHCYLESKTCKLMKEVISGNEELSSKKGSFPLYVGVQPSHNPVTTQTGLLLAYLTTNPANISKDNCTAGSNSKRFSYFWLNGKANKGLCINTTLKFTPAVSPAFLISDYNWTSRVYSTWTESVWNDVSLEMFLKPSRKQEIITLSCGLGTLLVSFLVIFYINKNKKFVDIFSRPSPAVC